MCSGEDHHEEFHKQLRTASVDEKELHEMIKKKLISSGKTEKEAEAAVKKWDETYGSH